MKKKIFIFITVLILMPVCANATINSNSKVLDGIEYYVQTDKFTYEFGEEVEMLYRVTNISDHNVTFNFPQSPVWNFWVEKDDQLVYQAVKGWWLMGTQFTLAPDGYRDFPNHESPFMWNLHNDEGELIGIGNYDVTGGLYGESYDYAKVSVSIGITPEPTTLVLLAIGLPVFRAITRRKT